MKKNIKIVNLFTEEELQLLNQTIDSVPEHNTRINPVLSRITFDEARVPDSIVEKITKLANSVSGYDYDLKMVYPPSCVEYSSQYGQPQLKPHFDGDYNDLIIDYQLSSNTTWQLGVDLSVYDLEDNSALIFNPNKNIHWRPRKTFQPNEYVRMIFFRFFNPSSPSDYSHLPDHPDSPIFAEANALRDSLKA